MLGELFFIINYHLKDCNLLQSRDFLIHCLAGNATIRCLATQTTHLVHEACQRHRTAPTASAALGRTLTGALLLGNTLKDLEKVTVQFRCQGIIGNITAEADAHGNVRGYVFNPDADLPANAQGKLDVSGIVGEGTLYVIREAAAEIGLAREPYHGSVPITSGEIAYDFAYYLTISEQIPSAVSLGVFVDPSGEVSAAGGFIIQMMPGAEQSSIDQIIANIDQMPPITTLLRAGKGPVDFLQAALGDIDFQVLEEKAVQFRCQCSRERAIGIITALGKEEVTDMLAKDGQAEMTCHFCSAQYLLTREDLEQILMSVESAN
jgi:molecular chaperone Hsp33